MAKCTTPHWPRPSKKVCWNQKANQCENCAPDFHEHLAANQAHAKTDAAREQLHVASRQVNYTEGVDLSPDAYVASPTAATNLQAPKLTCTGCGATLSATAKFCGDCGQPAAKPGPKSCGKCGAVTESKFCPECGAKISAS